MSVDPRRRPPVGPRRLLEMKHMPHGARASFALVSLREDATFVGGRYIALKAARILVDALHFNRSASTFEDLDRISASRLPFVHVADAPVQASYTTEELLHAGRVERLPPARAASISSAF
jgi:hypothetical protein